MVVNYNNKLSAIIAASLTFQEQKIMFYRRLLIYQNYGELFYNESLKYSARCIQYTPSLLVVILEQVFCLFYVRL